MVHYDWIVLNPQPLPPKVQFVNRQFPSDWVTLNSQPLPPRVFRGGGFSLD